MWRTIPLTKIVLRMLVFGTVLGLVQSLLRIFAFEGSIPEPRSYFIPQIIKGGVYEGAILGALIGLAMALYAGIVHRSIQNPHLFKFALLIVATIVSFVVVQQPFHIVTWIQLGIPLDTWFRHFSDSVLTPMFVATIANHVAIGLMCLYAASRYLSEASTQFMKSTGQEPA